MQTTNATIISQYEDIDKPLSTQNIINDNTIEIDLITGIVKKGKLKIQYETIDTVSEILTNKFLDYFRNGGDMKNLTPSAIYGKSK